MELLMTPYEILGILPGATLTEIKAAYRARMMQCHPDKGGSDEEAKKVNAAYEALTKPVIPQPPVRPAYGFYVRVVYGNWTTTANTTTTGWW
jgi:preprotein translocase subunit Sec63